MDVHGTTAQLDRAEPEPAPAIVRDRPVAASPTQLERWIHPLMWVGVLVFAGITTPTAEVEPPAFQAAFGEVVSWAALAAFIGLIAAAVAGRSTLRGWSLGFGLVALTGLAACQAFGHPVISSAWGLSQLSLVIAGTAFASRTT